MRKGDQLCILRAEVNAPRASASTNAERTPHGHRSANTDADALNLLRLVAALTVIGIPLDDDCPYLETRELVEGAERRLVTWTLKARSICGQHDARKLIDAWHDPVWTTQNAEHPFAYITTAFRNAGLLAAEIGRLAPVALIRKGQRFALVPFDATAERRQELLTALENEHRRTHADQHRHVHHARARGRRYHAAAFLSGHTHNLPRTRPQDGCWR